MVVSKNSFHPFCRISVNQRFRDESSVPPAPDQDYDSDADDEYLETLDAEESGEENYSLDEEDLGEEIKTKKPRRSRRLSATVSEGSETSETKDKVEEEWPEVYTDELRSESGEDIDDDQSMIFSPLSEQPPIQLF